MLMTVSTSPRNRLRWRFAWATLFTTTLATCMVLAGCAATDEYAETPPQPSEVSSSERALSPATVVALQNCVTARASGLSRHSYDLSFEVEATAKGVVRGVESKGSRLDDVELEACMVRVLENLDVRDLVPQEEVSPATSQGTLPPARSLIGNTMVLPQVIRLVPVVIAAPGGITIVVGVVIIVAVAAVVGGKMSRECKKQWKDAEEYCDELLATPNPSPNLTGGYTNRNDCARGHVDERCGGNRLEWGNQGKPGRRY